MIQVMGRDEKVRGKLTWHLVANLVGLECAQCRHWIPDVRSAMILEQVRERVAQDETGLAVRAKVSKLARGNLGIYLPESVREFMDLGSHVMLQPIDRQTLMVRTVSDAEGSKLRRKDETAGSGA